GSRRWWWWRWWRRGCRRLRRGRRRRRWRRRWARLRRRARRGCGWRRRGGWRRRERSRRRRLRLRLRLGRLRRCGLIGFGRPGRREIVGCDEVDRDGLHRGRMTEPRADEHRGSDQREMDDERDRKATDDGAPAQPP